MRSGAGRDLRSAGRDRAIRVLRAALGIALAHAAPAVAQDVGRARIDAPGGQLAVGDDRPATAVSQVGRVQRQPEGSITGADQLPRPPAGTTPATFVPADDGTPLSQIAGPALPVPSPSQLSPDDRGVQAGGRLTGSGESRDVIAARVEGADRCDPQAPGRAAMTACRQVIETRAGSFARERPDLSPEQRLLAERDRQEDRPGLLAEVRRVGRNNVDPDSGETQALAAIVEAQRADPPAVPADPEAGKQAADAVQAALSGAIPPQQ